MHQIEHKILTQFQKNPQKEFSTTDIIMESSPDEYFSIQESLKSIDTKACRLAMQKKAQLHRKFLYHINALVDQQVLAVKGVRGKGEKIFSLGIDTGNILIVKKNRQILITKNSNATHTSDEIEKEGLIYRFDSERWASKTNCVLYEAYAEGLLSYYSQIRQAFTELNDAVGINGFEKYIYSTSQENLAYLLSMMDSDSRDLAICINLIIDLQKCAWDNKFAAFISEYCKLKPKSVFINFLSCPMSLKKNELALKEIIKAFSAHEIKLNVQNINIRIPPTLIGNAGTYSLPAIDWQNYISARKETKKGVSIATSSIAIDMHKCFMAGLTSSEIRAVAVKSAKILLKASIDRAKNNESLRKLSLKSQDREFFLYEKSILRFWNYDLQDKNCANTCLLLQSIAEEIERFCTAHRAIYNSCGLPSGFDVSFSSAFSGFSRSLSPKSYSKMTIRKITDFQEEGIGSFISKKEDVAKVFAAGDRSRFFRKGELTAPDVFRELIFLLSSTTLDLITYDFRENRGDSKLTSYL
jgi:hypothetical protein